MRREKDSSTLKVTWLKTTPRKMTPRGKNSRSYYPDTHNLSCWSDGYQDVHILSTACIICICNGLYVNVHFLSNNKATLDPSRKFLLSCKDKMKQAEENRSSGWCLHLKLCLYLQRLCGICTRLTSGCFEAFEANSDTINHMSALLF